MFDVEYRPRTAIKSQALADFIVEWLEYQTPTPVEVYEYWTMFFDGSLKWEGGGAGIVLVSPTGEKLKYILLLHFEVSNNAAEYEAILYGLRIAISLCIKRLVIHGDSQLVVIMIRLIPR